jgi:hypothetical protein
VDCQPEIGRTDHEIVQGEMINGTSYLSWLEYPDSREAS